MGDKKQKAMEQSMGEPKKPGSFSKKLKESGQRLRREAREVREFKKLYDLLAKNISDVIVILNLNLEYTYVSPSEKHVFGYTPEEVISQPMSKFGTPSSIEKASQILMEELSLEGMPGVNPHRTRSLEFEAIHKNGKIINTETKLSFLRDSNGEITGVLGVVRDISERINAGEMLRSLNNRLTDIIDFLPDATFVTNCEGKVIAWNRAIEEMTGVPKKDIIGKGDYAYSVPFYGVPRPGLVDYISLKEEEIRNNYELIKRKGSTLYAEAYIPRVYGGKGAYLWIKASPLYDSSGNITGGIESIRDITEFKKMAQELGRRRDQLEELVKERTAEIILAQKQIKKEQAERKHIEMEMARLDRLNLVGKMAAAMGHEIRNPLTAIRGFLQLLQHKEECQKYRNYFDIMIGELDSANDIISEYLSTARDKYVEMKLQNLNSIIRTISPLLSASALEKNCEVVFKLEKIPELMLNEKEIRQLILNLTRNALDSMQGDGEITISTFAENNDVVLAVKDQGKGIDPIIADRIGTPFLTTKDSGTGLGLAICYGIAKRHNATIDFTTDPKGTTFFLRFLNIKRD